MWKFFLHRMRRGSTIPKPQTRKLSLERLEDREVPAVITVTSLADTVAVDGVVTLREAVQSANNNLDANADVTARRTGTYGDDRIIFAANLGNGVITLTQNDANAFFGPTGLVIASTSRVSPETLTIDGRTGTNSSVTVDGNRVRRLFAVDFENTLNLTNITLQNGLALGGNGGAGGQGGGGGGAAGLGGAIYNLGTLNVSHSTFVSNQAIGGNGGAGVANVTAPGGGGGGGGPGFNGGNGASNGGGGGGGGVNGPGGNGPTTGGGLGGLNANNISATEGSDSFDGGGGGGGGVGQSNGNGGNGQQFGIRPDGGGGGGGSSTSQDFFSNIGGSGGFGSGGGGGGGGLNRNISFPGSGGFGGGGGGGAANLSTAVDGSFTEFGGGDGADGQTNGVIASSGAGGGGMGAGGAIFNVEGEVSIVNSTFTNNTAQGGTAGGPGAGAGDSLGGAIFNYNGDIVITNSTLSGNNAATNGRQVYVLSGVPGGEGQAEASATIRNSILGQASNTQTDYYQSSFSGGTVTSSGTNNLIRRNATGTNAFEGSSSSADPQVNALANNGGPTRTMALREGSPAIDAATNLVSVDQRYVARPQRQANDIGAFELPPPAPPPVNVPTSLVIFPTTTKVCIGDPFGLTVQARTSTGINTTINEPLTARILLGPAGGFLRQNGQPTAAVTVSFRNGVAVFSGLSLSRPGTYLLQTFTPSGLSMTVSITVTDILGRRRGAR